MSNIPPENLETIKWILTMPALTDDFRDPNWARIGEEANERFVAKLTEGSFFAERKPCVNRAVGKSRRAAARTLGRAANLFGRGQGRGGIVKRKR
jgi:hypothetical protein